jgi:hypothetical protein
MTVSCDISSAPKRRLFAADWQEVTVVQQCVCYRFENAGANEAQDTWMPAAQATLDKLRDYPENWDDKGAEAPNPTARFHARNALAEIHALGFQEPRIMASVENGVAITFREGRRSATLEFYNTGEAIAVVSDGESEPRVWDVESDKDAINRSLLEFIRHLYAR